MRKTEKFRQTSLMSEEHDLTGKTARWLAGISVMTTLLLFSPFSAAFGGGGGEETTTTTTTTTIITRQDGNNSSNGQNETSTSSIIVDSGQDDGTGGLAGDIGDRIEELISSVTNNTSEVDMQLSGKIAGAQINLDSGQVEQTLFGDWSMDISSINNASFVAEFTAGNNSAEDAHYRIGNLSLTSFQRINDHVALGGTVHVEEEREMQSWEETPVSILVISDKTIAISFEEPELDEAFAGQPVIGVATGTPAQ